MISYHPKRFLSSWIQHPAPWEQHKQVSKFQEITSKCVSSLGSHLLIFRFKKYFKIYCFTDSLRNFGMQHTQFQIARMATKLVASRLIIRNAATALEDNHPNHVTLCSMAKLYATEACFEVYFTFFSPNNKAVVTEVFFLCIRLSMLLYSCMEAMAT